ncbi:MFS transporter [Brenneria goodwinii]|uniref:MFS transporter n=1 Tax=Brenneria goodwinii TaxID=1109412 RepID=UPI000EF1C4F0|nr:MFS transporter [Brenneria goodwinii]MCG8154642.1 MFS transporter [Brenneria goodwinii]MCG8160022.1 MFS transporter [Brenneria goodwinii]MCG8163880.1 MFS transporter [Brenneria goodwinii]MCG8168489.1 MFS transporter [Brenneria goodwinii]MCG8173956.1 MFS transporter [Brenneria goodwinii]
MNKIYATRIVFFSAGLIIAAWAPLIPIVKEALNVNTGVLGILLLFLGLGSIISMPITGMLSARYGCQRVIITSALLTIISFPFLVISQTPIELGISLFFFGASIGTVDVSMNIQAVKVEKGFNKNLMSGFHGFFSLGGIGGAAGMSFMIYLGVTALLACYLMSFLLVILFSISYSGLVRSGEKENKKYFSLPKGIIIHVCLLCFLMGVIEGSIIDWGALFITTELGMPPSVSGLGYVTFAFAMMLGRFFGVKLVTLYGRNKVFFISSISIGLGFLLVINFGVLFITLIGFICIGLGASNMVPILCSTSGRQSIMAPSHAVAAIVTFGYAGIMIGPVLIGFIAHLSGLTLAFFILALSTMFLMLSARIIR